ncbi:hypothetical protein [Arthrobacter sp. VKM Ac-2550]|uniref:hypothetical protein n=1 Tax=Crystallibacter permensis TaxID=1938888 RepID=UPI0022262FAF|nr:hypothetical protein [Arthrobacter sp. VKM Ac-2550]MCW2135013.1 hypothetical protein [Arthrobacter sp. VKM Ac-2550]
MSAMITREELNLTPIMQEAATAYCERTEGMEPFDSLPKVVQERLLSQMTPIVWAALPAAIKQVEQLAANRQGAVETFTVPDTLEGLL